MQLVCCRQGRPRIPRSALVDFIPRQLQIFWQQRRPSRCPYPWIEVLASDRHAWQDQLPLWLRRWGYSDVVAAMPPNYLLDRQLLLVGDKLAVLRPARVFPESPYGSELCHVIQSVPTRRTWVCWVVHFKRHVHSESCCTRLLD